MIISMPFPFTCRHSIVLTQIYQDTLNGDIVINEKDARLGYLHKLSHEKQESLGNQKKKYVLVWDFKSH